MPLAANASRPTLPSSLSEKDNIGHEIHSQKQDRRQKRSFQKNQKENKARLPAWIRYRLVDEGFRPAHQLPSFHKQSALEIWILGGPKCWNPVTHDRAPRDSGRVGLVVRGKSSV